MTLYYGDPPQQWPPQQPPPPLQQVYGEPPPPKKGGKLRWVLLAVLCGLVVLVVALALMLAGEPTPPHAPLVVTPTATQPHTARPTAAKAFTKNPQPVAVQFGAGTWKVGPEVKAGTYTTTAKGGPCYWERIKSFDGDFDSIIANGNLDQGAHGRITIKSTDGGITFSGDCVWTKDK
jgi:hypothetical protein